MKIKVPTLADARKIPILARFDACTLNYVVNAGNLAADGRLNVEETIRLPEEVDVEVCRFLDKDFIHNERAYFSIGDDVATIEMFIGAMPQLQIDPEIKWVIILGTLVRDPSVGRDGVFAYDVKKGELCLVHPMTDWKSPWNSKEVGYLVVKK